MPPFPTPHPKWQAESAIEANPEELRSQLQGFWRLLFTSSSARARDGVTGYGALHIVHQQIAFLLHYTLMHHTYCVGATCFGADSSQARRCAL